MKSAKWKVEFSSNDTIMSLSTLHFSLLHGSLLLTNLQNCAIMSESILKGDHTMSEKIVKKGVGGHADREEFLRSAIPVATALFLQIGRASCRERV